MQEWLVPLVGEGLAPIVSTIVAAVVVILLALVVIQLAKRLFGGGIGIGSRGQAPRLAVLDVTGIDQRRKLVLVRRDEVEHLILIGGPNDLVVEPGILRGVPRGRPQQRVEPQLRAEPQMAVGPRAEAGGRASGEAPRGPQGAASQAPARPVPIPPAASTASGVMNDRAGAAGAPPRRTAAAPRVEPVLDPVMERNQSSAGREVVEAARQRAAVAPDAQVRNGPLLQPESPELRQAPERGPDRPSPVPRVEPDLGPDRGQAPMVLPVEGPRAGRTQTVSSVAERVPAVEPVSAPPNPHPRMAEPVRPPLRPAAPAPERSDRLPPPIAPQTQPRSMATPTLSRANPVTAAQREPDQPAGLSPVASMPAEAERPAPATTPEAPASTSPAPETSGQPTRQPLSVRSFATSIQNHRAPEPQPAPPQRIEASERPAPVSPQRRSEAADQDDALADLLAAEFAAPDLGGRTEPDQASQPDAPSAPSERAPDRTLTLEEEMERLLQDFSIDTSDRRR